MGKSLSGAISIEQSEGFRALAAIVERVLTEPKGMVKEVLRSRRRSVPQQRKAVMSKEVFDRYAAHYRNCD